MKIQFMRDVDMKLGGFLVFLVKLLTFISIKFNSSQSDLKNVKKIIFIKFFGGGSILLATPMIRELKNVFSGSSIQVLTFQENFELCSRLKIFDEIITIRKHSIAVFFKDTINVLIKLRKLNPEVVIDGEYFSNFSSLISWFSGSRVRVGFSERQVARGDILTHPVSLNVHKHVTRVFYSLAVVLGAKHEDANLSQLALPIPSEEEITGAFSKINVDSEVPFIVINPNAGAMSYLRRWPAEHFIELTLSLQKKYPEYNFLFIGSKNETSYVSSIVERVLASNVIDCTGALSFQDLCAVIYKSTFIVTNDSMPLHLASAYDKDIVCFFGPETPRFYGPPHPNSLVYFEDIPCSPCLMTWDNKAGTDCNDNICLQQVLPSRVMRDIQVWHDSTGQTKGSDLTKKF